MVDRTRRWYIPCNHVDNGAGSWKLGGAGPGEWEEEEEEEEEEEGKGEFVV